MTISAEENWLSAAISGDQYAFEQLAEVYRNELIIHCYRITGCSQDAEDMVQETMYKSWKHISSFRKESSFRAWMYGIATNTCLDLLKKKRRRSLPSEVVSPSDPKQPFSPPIADPIWLEPIADELLSGMNESPESAYSQKESITLAFILVLQTLPARQRAILILRDVLGFRTKETANLLQLSESAVHSALFRARGTIQNAYSTKPVPQPDVSTQLALYVEAWEDANIDKLVNLLKADATFMMPPSPSWYSGRDSILAMMAGALFSGDTQGRWKLVSVGANSQPAFGLYQYSDEDRLYHAFGIHVLTFDGNKIKEITHFFQPELFPHFNLPEKIKR
jgi:RNA polymerase sigma-70 factor (ECF subfamily)